MKFREKRKHNQEGDEKPAIVQPNFDSKDSSELDLRSQVGYLIRSAHRRAALLDSVGRHWQVTPVTCTTSEGGWSFGDGHT